MKVSVIIPMYNAKKYLAVCLESLLIQTFADFEVIVVDDCSTDSSATVAESYLEKFGGRLKILMLEENTGSGAVPRNVGLEFSQGKYVCFVDADDLLVDDALKTFYQFAEDYRADVVYTEAGYLCDKEPIPEFIVEDPWDEKLKVTEPTLETENFAIRMQKFCETFIRWPAWGKFLRRAFLVDNNIKFPPMKISEDGIWTFELLCLAKNFLHVPTPLYVKRANSESITSCTRSPANEIKFWLDPLIKGLDCLDEFMNRFDFFERHPNYRVYVLNTFANSSFIQMSSAFEKLEPGELFKIFSEEFSKSKGEHTALFAYLMFIVNRYWNDLRNAHD